MIEGQNDNLAWVVQTLDIAVHEINYFSADSIRETNCTIQWIHKIIDYFIQWIALSIF